MLDFSCPVSKEAKRIWCQVSMGTFTISIKDILKKCSTYQTYPSINAILPGLSACEYLFAFPDSHIIKPWFPRLIQVYHHVFYGVKSFLREYCSASSQQVAPQEGATIKYQQLLFA